MCYVWVFVLLFRNCVYSYQHTHIIDIVNIGLIDNQYSTYMRHPIVCLILILVISLCVSPISAFIIVDNDICCVVITVFWIFCIVLLLVVWIIILCVCAVVCVCVVLVVCICVNNNNTINMLCIRWLYIIISCVKISTIIMF